MMTEHKPLQLFGRPIFSPDQGLTLTGQVREILLEEIHNSRWQVGDRLPSVAVLARQSGLSRWPIQEAFESLRKEGYLRQSERSGTFLESMAPNGHKPLGSVGIAIMLRDEMGNWQTPPFYQFRLARIMEVAEARHYAVEVKYLHSNDRWEDLDKVGEFFSSSVVGVISLHPFPHPASSELGRDRLPFVYLGGNNNECLPTVAGDTANGFYMMTRKAIEAGHRNIICFCNPNDSAWETGNRVEAHQRAMHEAGLEVNQAAIERSLQVSDERDLSALCGYLKEFSDATCIICMWGGADFHLIEVATMLGISVPEDLSIMGHGAGPMGVNKPGAEMTCLEYDMELMIHTCFDLLIAQKNKRRVEVSKMLCNPHIHMGDSLTAPKNGVPVAQAAMAANGRGGRKKA